MSAIKHFIDESIRREEIDEFLAKELEKAGYANAEIARTPLGTRIVIYAMKPGLVIGRRGENIRELTKIIEEKFKLSNPQIAVSEIEVPELNRTDYGFKDCRCPSERHTLQANRILGIKPDNESRRARR